jgi:hypothetical protein
MSNAYYPQNYSFFIAFGSISFDFIGVNNSPNGDTGRDVEVSRKLDYGNFDLQWLARFLGYTLAHNPPKERSWWWQHGYPLKRNINGVVKHRWVYAECVAKYIRHG